MDVVSVKLISPIVLSPWSDKLQEIHGCVLVIEITCSIHPVPLLVDVPPDMERVQDIDNDGESVLG